MSIETPVPEYSTKRAGLVDPVPVPVFPVCANDRPVLSASHFDPSAIVLDSVNLVIALADDIERLEQRREEHKKFLADTLGVGTHEVGGYKVSVTLPNRWTIDGKKAFKNEYPLDGYPHFYKAPDVNTKAADTILNENTPGYTDQWKALGDPVVTIR